MVYVSVADAKNRLSELIARVEAGEQIAVTRRGKPVIRLMPVEAVDRKAQREQVAEVFRRLDALRKQVRLEGDLKSIAREGLD